MTLAQFAIARVAANLERADGLTAGEARLLSEVLAPAVARYALDDGAAESPALSTGEGRTVGKNSGGCGDRSPARQFGRFAMLNVRLVLLVLAFLSLGAAAVGVPSRVNLVAAGLALWVLAVLLA